MPRFEIVKRLSFSITKNDQQNRSGTDNQFAKW